MPKEVQGFTGNGVDSEFASYSKEGFVGSLIASWFDGLTLEDKVGLVEDPQEVGVWTCEFKPGLDEARCFTEAYEGVVTVEGLKTVEEMAAFGDEFLSLWK